MSGKQQSPTGINQISGKEKEEKGFKELEKIFNPPRRFKKFSETAGHSSPAHLDTDFKN